MCLWLLTACLGMLPSNPTFVVVPGVPAPIITPTTAATTAATNATGPPGMGMGMPGNMTGPPMGMGSMPTAPTSATTGAPPTIPPMTMPSSSNPPMTMPTGTMPPVTMAPPTMPPTSAPTATSSPTPMPTSTIGPLPIDPRLGTTPAPSAAINMPPVMGYSAPVPSYDSAVNFPRQRRSIDRIGSHLARSQITITKHNRVKRQSCACVPTGTCNRGNSGAGMIDIRIVTPGASQCPTGQEYCCGGTTTAAVACGKLQTVPAVAVAPAAGQANFGEFPWQALILTKQNDYVAGGVLIDSLNVLTVTHRMSSFVVSGTAPNIKVRLGEWDAAGTYEPVPFQEYTVTKVFSHPMYNANTLQYDITVLRLSSAVPFTPTTGAATTINRACLPAVSTATYTGMRCMVSGWGKNMFGIQGQYQQIMKKVDVPIVAPATCQTQLQTARLGASYVLDTTSFICAGGEANKDSCTGDGGSGLVCQVNGSWVVVGLVAWGLGCAAANVPAAYVNVAALLPWIQQQIAAP